MCRCDANLAVSAFYLRKEKDDEKKILEDKDLEVLGSPIIKYGDSTVIVQHVETSLWLSYKVYNRNCVTGIIISQPVFCSPYFILGPDL